MDARNHGLGQSELGASRLHKSKIGHAELMIQPVIRDTGSSVPISWDLTIWPKRRAGKTNIDEARSRPQSQLELFEEMILPHLDAAYNLARWLIRNDQDAQDVVQESFLRAFRFFDGYRGGDAKAWLLAVVRNTCRTWQLRQNRERAAVPFDEIAHSGNGLAPDQEQSVVDRERVGVLRTCIETLPIDFREVLVMRELEEMSYREIANTLGVALGTVMSRLSRARKRLEECVASRMLEAAR
jgi:RNA polymerase sigma factor (sigma-70 family)